MVVRELGQYEKLFHWAVMQRDSWFPVQTAILTENKITNIEQVFVQASLLLVNRYQVLSSYIAKDTVDGKLKYVCVGPAKAQEIALNNNNIVVVDKSAGNINWQQYSSDMVQQGRNLFSVTDSFANAETGLLWKWVLLYNSVDSMDSVELVMTVHHSVADGSGFMALLNSLLEIMDDLASGSQVRNTYHPILTEVEKRLPRFIPRSEEPKTLVLSEYSKPGIVPASVRRQRTNYLVISKETTAKLLQSCRNHGTTMNGAIGAAVIAAGHRLLQSPHTVNSEQLAYSVHVSISTRNYCIPPVAYDEVGLYYSGCSTKIRQIDCHDFWNTAKSVQQQVLDLLQHPDSLNTSSVDGWFDSLTKFLSSSTIEERNGRTDHFSLSNRGNVDHFFEPRNSFKLSELYVISTQWSLGNYVSCHCLTLNGKLMLSIAGIEPLFEEHMINSLAEDVKNFIEKNA